MLRRKNAIQAKEDAEKAAASFVKGTAFDRLY